MQATDRQDPRLELHVERVLTVRANTNTEPQAWFERGGPWINRGTSSLHPFPPLGMKERVREGRERRCSDSWSGCASKCWWFSCSMNRQFQHGDLANTEKDCFHSFLRASVSSETLRLKHRRTLQRMKFMVPTHQPCRNWVLYELALAALSPPEVFKCLSQPCRCLLKTFAPIRCSA